MADVELLLAIAERRQLETQVATTLRLDVLPADSTIKRLLLAEISQAGIPIGDVRAALVSKKDQLVNFGVRWNHLCRQRDYGEEHDPEEGDQQDGDRREAVVGISEGFGITYALFVIHAAIGKKDLVSYLRRRRIPHAKNTAADILSLTKAPRGRR
jgi:hypothetical protein